MTNPARPAAVLDSPARELAMHISLATEFLMTAQRALLRGFPTTDPEVTEPLRWVQLRMSWVPAPSSVSALPAPNALPTSHVCAGL